MRRKYGLTRTQQTRVFEQSDSYVHPDASNRLERLGAQFLPFRAPAIVKLVNITSDTVSRGQVLVLSDYAISTDETLVDEYPIWNGIAPSADESRPFAVLLDSAISNGDPVSGVVIGAVQATVDVQDTAHMHATIAEDSHTLVSGSTGRAEILWQPEQPELGEKSCLVMVASHAESMRVVRMSQSGGEDGTANAAPTWTYDLLTWDGGFVVEQGVDPVIPPHMHQRHIGRMLPATVGIQQRSVDGSWAFVFCNEVTVFEACPDDPQYTMIYDEATADADELGQSS